MSWFTGSHTPGRSGETHPGRICPQLDRGKEAVWPHSPDVEPPTWTELHVPPKVDNLCPGRLPGMGTPGCPSSTSTELVGAAGHSWGQTIVLYRGGIGVQGPVDVLQDGRNGTVEGDLECLPGHCRPPRWYIHCDLTHCYVRSSRITLRLYIHIEPSSDKSFNWKQNKLISMM